MPATTTVMMSKLNYLITAKDYSTYSEISVNVSDAVSLNSEELKANKASVSSLSVAVIKTNTYFDLYLILESLTEVLWTNSVMLDVRLDAL